MIGQGDCMAMCGLEPEEVAVICEHEHICEAQAAALGSYLLHQAYGAERVRTMIIEVIHECLADPAGVAIAARRTLRADFAGQAAAIRSSVASRRML
jgi:hypothetical protein